MSVRVPNTSQAEQPPPPPTRPDGTLYPNEIIYGGGRWRGYADTHDQLLDQLIDGYTDLPTDDERLRARIRLAVDAQVTVQAGLTAAGSALAECDEAERQLLLGPRDTPPVIDAWRAPIPLVLVTSFYHPAGSYPRPAEEGDGQIWWLDPTDATTLLQSLSAAGYLQLNQLNPPPEAATG